MQGFSTSGQQPSNVFSTALQHASSLFTFRRVSYTLAGAFVFAGAAVAVQATNPSEQPKQSVKASQVLNSSSNTAPSATTPSNSDSAASASTSTNVSATTSANGTPQVSVSVNGEDLAVPQNGSTQHTTTNPDGSTTTTNISSSASGQGSASNSSHSSFSLDVHSSSSLEGGVTTNQ